MKTPHRKIKWSLLLLLGLVLFLPPGRSGAAFADAAEERAFLAPADVATADLVETTIPALDFPKKRPPSFLARMTRTNRDKVKTAELTVAGRAFKIILGDHPRYEFYLHDVATDRGPYWWGSWSAHSYHKIGDRFFQFMIVADGTKIAGRVYPGPFGTIQAGKGGRDIEKVQFNGSVDQDGSVSAPIGEPEDYWTSAVTECQIPVGDYTANLMTVSHDHLRIEISNNYHTNAQGQSRGDKKTVYGMQVREDKPYILDFSNAPAVVFDQPAKETSTFARGEEIKFAAVLIDPKLDVMIRGLEDASVKVDKEYKDSEGNVTSRYKVNKSLDPKVVITRSDGEVVAEGVMPFG